MKLRCALVCFGFVTLTLVAATPGVFGQESPPPPAAPAPPEPNEVPNAVPNGPSVEQRLTDLEGRVEGLHEPFLEVQSTVAALKKLKFSGYLQGQYQWHDDANFGLDPKDNSTRRGTNRFLVRRARLKTTYTGYLSEYMLQVDAAGSEDATTLKDAEASLVLDNTVIPSRHEWELKVTMGQFKVPFGYEVVQSSGDRELPERSLFIRRFYPNERDRGLRLQGTYRWLVARAAIINGNFTNDPIYKTFDQTSFKDVVGRVGADLGFMSGGLSAHWGHTLRTTVGKAASGTTPATPTTYDRFSRLRFGADAQVYLDVPRIGGLAIKGEVIWARDKNLDFSGVPADACKDLHSLGWYGLLVQNVGDHLGLVLRVDQYDANRNVGSACVASILDASQQDRVTTIAPEVLVYFSGNLKTALVYEHVIEQNGRKVANDAFTIQTQAKF